MGMDMVRGPRSTGPWPGGWRTRRRARSGFRKVVVIVGKREEKKRDDEEAGPAGGRPRQLRLAAG